MVPIPSAKLDGVGKALLTEHPDEPLERLAISYISADNSVRLTFLGRTSKAGI